MGLCFGLAASISDSAAGRKAGLKRLGCSRHGGGDSNTYPGRGGRGLANVQTNPYPVLAARDRAR